jgi:hypothetical protein
MSKNTRSNFKEWIDGIIERTLGVRTGSQKICIDSDHHRTSVSWGIDFYRRISGTDIALYLRDVGRIAAQHF